MITAYRNLFSNEPFYVSVDAALKRIQQGSSRSKVEEIRTTQDKDKASELKKDLPAICFSGKFTERKDSCLLEHSGYIVLDFDKLEDAPFTKQKVFDKAYVKAAWISPSGNGVKALVKIADGTKHREHFQALQDVFPDIDRSGINVSRVCFESWDTEILIRDEPQTFKKTKVIEKAYENVAQNEDDVFKKILIWLNNTGSAFVKGERNLYIFKLASACCRFGIHESNCASLIHSHITSGTSDFSRKEVDLSIRSAYKSSTFGTAEFKNEKLVEKSTYKEIEIDESIYDLSVRPKDVIYGIDCKQDALNMFRNGYEKVLSTGCKEIDNHFKFKKGELTLLTGIGNYGKSTFMKFLILIQALQGKKIALFSPEDAPAHEFYNDFVEMYFGKNCITGNDRPTEHQYEQVYDKVTKNIFFIYPKDIAPTPDYIKERFLELIIKEKVEFCIIDPFNQMTNDYNKSGGRSDKYLETLLSDFGRFAKQNELYFMIIAHPKMLQKKPDGNYPCPDVFDIADGAMWNNKMDNILVYHLPFRQTDEQNTMCEFHAKKIRKRKVVGNIGMLAMEYLPRSRRFIVGGTDYIGQLLQEQPRQAKIEISADDVQPSDPFGWNNLTGSFEKQEPPF